MIYCLDTLIELLQGPCKNNQNYLLDSSIIELLAEILDYRELSKKRSDYTITANTEVNTYGLQDTLKGKKYSGRSKSRRMS